MVSFSCESCGDVLTKKKLDAHRNRCHGEFTCLDCMVNFKGIEYRSHTSCISEAQKYQGKLYKDKKGAKPATNSQALVPKKEMETPPETDNQVAVVEVVPRAPSPPPGFNVFDFLIQNGDEQSNPKDTPVSSPSSSDSEETEESDSDSMEFDDEPGPVDDAYEAAREYMKQEMIKQGYVYGAESAEQTFERFQTYTQLPPSPAGQSGQFYTPGPTTRGHSRNISTASMDSATKESNKKRKRGHPEELDLSSARAYQTGVDVVMTDVAPLHSGLTGGLNRMLSRPELPPSPPEMDSSPHSPMKRSRHAKDTDKKFNDKNKKVENGNSNKKAKKEPPKKEKSTPKFSVTSVVVKDPKTGQLVRRRTRKEVPQQQPSEEKEQPARKQLKAIEYHPMENDSLQATPNNAMVLHSKKAISRAELFLSAATKNLDSDRGCSINKALKRYHKERSAKKSGEEEKELWKVLRVRKNDRGELVLFIPDGQE